MANISVLKGLRALVVGLGREGSALAAFLAARDVTVTATDLQSAAHLAETAARLEKAGVKLVLGEHPLSLLDEADILFVSPGVPLEAPLLQEAMARKIPLSAESRLFCHLCPAPVIGVTGSSGKTTTTTLVGKMLAAAEKKIWVGGNIGRPLIETVEQIQPDDWVVMELSSFQLEYFHARLNKNAALERFPADNRSELAALLDNWSPSISAILNITPNHLDRHPSMKHYVRAKRAVIDYQTPDDVTVMNLDNDITRTIGHQFGSRVRWFSLEAQPPKGAGLSNDQLVLYDEEGSAQVVARVGEIKLRGKHNLHNILAACLLATAADAPVAALRQVATSFAGVEHRLELVRRHNQVSYYNDSIATSPERLVAALQTFEEPLVLLAGGRDKHLPWNEAARLILHKTHDLILFGEATDLILEAIERVRPELAPVDTTVHRSADLAAAVQQAAAVAQPGDVVLLSPGCTSFDAFDNFAQRGQRFKQLVLDL